MEKQIRTIQKWLERCLVSCKAKSWERAIADMECANAELRLTREELWLQARNSKDTIPSRSFRNAGLVVKAFLFASLILMVSAAPVAVNQGILSRRASSDSKPVLEWLEKDEEMLIKALRQSLSENGFRETDLSDSVVQRGTQKTEMEVSVAQAGGHHSEATHGSLPVAQKQMKDPDSSVSGNSSPEITMEEILALLEIGQRVLRNPEPPIKVTQ